MTTPNLKDLLRQARFENWTSERLEAEIGEQFTVSKKRKPRAKAKKPTG